MILTKEWQAELVSEYINEKHNQDECIGFIDGVERAMQLVEKLNVLAVSGQSEERASEQFICPCCGSDKTYKTEAYHCNRCAVTTEV